MAEVNDRKMTGVGLLDLHVLLASRVCQDRRRRRTGGVGSLDRPDGAAAAGTGQGGPEPFRRRRDGRRAVLQDDQRRNSAR